MKCNNRLLYTLVHSFVLYQLATARTVIRFVCAGETTKQKQKQTQINAKTANTDANPNQSRDHPPGYWPRYSGTRCVRLLDGTWNASRLESLNSISVESADNGDRTLRRTSGSSSNTNINIDTRFDSMDSNIDISKIHTIERVTIPSTIEVIADPEHGYLPGYMGYRGVSFFRTHFETNEAAAARSTPESMGKRPPYQPAGRIQFQACSFYCRVWLNGVEIGDHTAGGYIAWWLDVSDDVLRLGRKRQPQSKSQQHLQKNSAPETVVRTHELFVLVDNRFNSTTAPLHTGGDFWHYGGIMRSVEWHDRPNPSLSSSTRVKTSKGNEAVHDGDRLHQGYSSVEAFFLKKETSVAPVTKNDGSNVTTSSRVAKRAMAGDQQQPISLLSDVWPWRLYITPQKDLRSVKLSLQVVGGNDGQRNRINADLLNELRQNNQIRIYFDGKATTNALDEGLLATYTRVDPDADSGPTEILPATGRDIDRLLDLGHFSVQNPRIWSTTDPQLHTVSVDLNGAIVTERFGLRFWDTGTVSDKSALATTEKHNTNASKNSTKTSTSSKIRLNGKILKLMGWNHHTQWPYTAASPTDEQLDEDIRLLKESGHANFVRGAHYPQDPRWLDRLDEHGIVVWSGEF
jgi:hypothetical protein